MSEFNLEFAERMSEASLAALESEKEESGRASLYMALVSTEIALKASLEQAGKKVPKTHDLAKLLELLSSCTIEIQVTPERRKRLPASRIKTVVVDEKYANAIIGNLLQAEKYGASAFPNEIRYGDILRHFSATTMQKLSVKVISWVREYFVTIKA